MSAASDKVETITVTSRDGGQRLDRWLWFARFFKSRTLATRFVADGHLRLNAERVVKAHHMVRVADVLTFAQGTRVRVIRVAALGARRGRKLNSSSALARWRRAPSYDSSSAGRRAPPALARRMARSSGVAPTPNSWSNARRGSRIIGSGWLGPAQLMVSV